MPVGQEIVPYTQQPTISSLPAPASLRDWWREFQGITPPVNSPVQSAVVGLRHNAEAGAVGALLALIDTDLGGLDLGGRVPLDWVGAALFYILSLQGADKPDSLSSDYRAMGQSCTTVAMYRMVHRWRELKKGIPRNIPQLFGDPVIAAGKTF
jgi:hypothetical protein